VVECKRITIKEFPSPLLATRSGEVNVCRLAGLVEKLRVVAQAPVNKEAIVSAFGAALFGV
jgi:hypothetical protein